MTSTPGKLLHPPRLREEEPREGEVLMGVQEFALLGLAIACVAIAFAFPFAGVKYGVMGMFGVVMWLQTLRRPAIGLAMLGFAMPALDLIPPDLIPIRAFNAETILTLALFFIWARANTLHGKDGLNTLVGKILLIYTLLIAFSCVRGYMIWSRSLFDLLSAAKNHATYFLFLPVALHTLRTRRDQLLVLVAVTLSLLLNCLQAIDHSWMALVVGNLERHRASAILATQPNLFGGALALYLPVLAMLAARRIGSTLLNLWFIGCAAACSFALLLTLSRGSWVGAAAGMVVLAAWRDKRLLILMIVAGVSWQVWLPQEIVDRIMITQHVSEESNSGAQDQIADDSTQMRIEQYKSLPAMMAPHPIIGWGYKSYSRVFEKHGTLGRPKGAHSTFCLFLTEEGLVGMGVYLWLFGAILLVCYRGSRLEDPLHKWLAIGLFGGAVAIFFAGAAGSRFETQKIYAYFWILLGIIEREVLLHAPARQAMRAGEALGPRSSAEDTA